LPAAGWTPNAKRLTPNAKRCLRWSGSFPENVWCLALSPAQRLPAPD